MAVLADSIAADIHSALAKDQLDLPSLPEVALEIRECAESEYVSATSLGAVVAKDPGPAAQVVRIANSPMFRATRSIDDLNQAISRLGVDYSANIVTGLAMRQMFQATSELVDNRLRQVWRRSSEVAGWTSILCKQYTRLRSDQAALAGLTHSIGTLPILSWVEENDGVIRDSLTLDKVIETLHPTLGSMILQHWNFAPEIVDVPNNYQSLSRDATNVDYIDLVCAANLLSLTDTDHPIMADRWQNAPAFERLGLDVAMEEFEREALREQVNELTGVFS